MDSWINTAILFNPINWIVIALVLIFMAYAAMAITQNAGVLTPKL